MVFPALSLKQAGNSQMKALLLISSGVFGALSIWFVASAVLQPLKVGDRGDPSWGMVRDLHLWGFPVSDGWPYPTNPIFWRWLHMLLGNTTRDNIDFWDIWDIWDQFRRCLGLSSRWTRWIVCVWTRQWLRCLRQWLCYVVFGITQLRWITG